MLNPILSFSATRRMRSARTLLVLGGWLAVMLGTALLMMGGLFRAEVTIRGLHSGVDCYNILMIVQFALIVLIAPAMTSGAVAGERERQTLELLLVTNTRSLRIVWGKALESFAMLALLLICGAPVMCLPVISGAVTPLQVGEGELYLLAVAFSAVCVGVLASSLSRSSVSGGILAYLMIFGIAAATTLPLFMDYPESVTNVVYDNRLLAGLSPADAAGMLSPLLFLNPGYGLAALLQGQTDFLGSLLRYQDTGRLLCSFKLMDRAGGELIALISAASFLILGVLLLFLSAVFVRRRGLSGKRK